MVVRSVLERYVGKACKLTVRPGRENLYFTVHTVLAVDDKHIIFLDRNMNEYTFLVGDVQEVSEVKTYG